MSIKKGLEDFRAGRIVGPLTLDDLLLPKEEDDSDEQEEQEKK